MSWGSVLAGALVMLALSLLLWGLALAIVLTVTHAQIGLGAARALWICAIGATLIGAFWGGAVAGRGRAFPRLHGFVAWAVGFLIATTVELGLLARAVARAPTDTRVIVGSWLWFGTWLLAALLATAGGGRSVRKWQRRVA